jgi:hypothetical protein
MKAGPKPITVLLTAENVLTVIQAPNKVLELVPSLDIG